MRRNLLLTPFLLIIGLFSAHRSLGQTILGPSPVGLNSTYVYSASPGTILIAPTWTVSKGTIVQNNGSSITVTWTSTGTGNVRLYDVDGPVATKSMSIISCSAVTVPSISSAYTCTGNTATLNATVGSGGTGIRWYDSSTNPQILASTTNYTTYALPGSTTFYAATVTSAGCESAKVSITVQIPSIPTAADVARCGAGTVMLNATAGANGTRWYAGATGGPVLATAANFTTPSLSINGIYYASSYNATTQCESFTRKAVNVAIDYTGAIGPANAPAFGSYTGSFTLSGQTGTIVRWEKNVDNAGWVTIANTTTSNNYTIANVSNTQLRAVVNNAGCGNPSYSTTATVNVYPVPQILVNGATPVPPVYNNYGYGVTLSIPAMGYYTAYQWYKNGTAISGATSSSYSVGLPGNYTVMVWSGSASVESAALTVYEPNIEGDSINAVSRTVFIKAGTNAVSPYTLQPNDLLQTVQYSDGLGRAVQTIGVGQSLPSDGVAGDLVVPTVYGRDGLADTSFLPYTTTQVQGKFRSKAVRGSTAYNSYTTSEQYLYYQGTAKVASDNNPFARVVFRNTPDARVVEQGAPGAAWQPGTQHTVRSQMNLATSATFPTLQWKANGTTTGYYPDNTIWVTTQTDENNHTFNVYTDKKGKAILKQQQTAAGTYLLTYYVYDDNGQLIYQLPPKAMAVLGAGTTLDANNPAIAELIYQYKYDSAGQVIEQKVPGSGKKSIVYDKLGRVVLTQDANQKAQGVWAFIKYDFKNRPIYSGTYTSAADRITLQKLFTNNKYDTQLWYETRAVNATYHGYSNGIFPNTGLQLMSVNYYDDYDFDFNGTADYTYDASDYGGAAAPFTRGMATGSKKLILGSVNWLVSVIFYDNFDRPIQTRSNNHLNLTVADRTSIQYFTNNLSSKPQRIKVTHAGTSTVTTVQRFEYDNLWRTTAIYHTINPASGGNEQQVAAYEYNALGQVVDKKLHNTGGSNYLQSVDYRYNIRGWLTSINNAQLVNDTNTTATNDETNDYFGMELFYNTAESSALGNTPYYNGTLSAIKWKNGGATSGAADQRSYKYNYDWSNRLTSASFTAFNGAWTKEGGTLDETMTYDVNGNMTSLTRKQNQRGLAVVNSVPSVTSTAQTIDQLTYTYTTGNQLSKVDDASSNTTGFADGSAGTTEYTYNTDGDLITDANKGIGSITYNVLGKPLLVTYSNGTTIAYTYDAAGSKLKTVTTTGGVSTTMDYVSQFVYTNNALTFFSSPEGRVVKNGANYEYQYALTDHQGNTRVLFTSVAPAPIVVPTATMETVTDTNYLNYTKLINFELFDHTDVGMDATDYAQKLTGATNAQVGLAKSFKVYPGDKVKIEAYAKYWNAGSTPSDLSGFATALTSAFGVSAASTGDALKAYNTLTSYGGLVVAGNGHTNSSTDPIVGVTILIFDKDYKLLDATWKQLNVNSVQVGATPKAPHEYLSAEYVAKEAGYAYMYVSNESPTLVDAYFDDIAMSLTPSNILQSNEYYPYGLQTANSWTRDNTTANNFLGNGGTELNKTTQLYDLDFRNYDPILGRLNQVDPLADKFSSISPYHFSFNNPVTFSDPSGLSPITDGTYNPWDPFGRSAMGRDQAYSHGGATGGPRWDGSGGYFNDANGNGVQDGGEEMMSWGEVRSYYGSSLSVTTFSGDQVRSIVNAYNNYTRGSYSLSETGRVLVSNYGGEGYMGLKATFYQIDSRGNWYVPYTNVTMSAYLSSLSSNEFGNNTYSDVQGPNSPKAYWKMFADGFLNFTSISVESHLYQMTKSGTQIALSSKSAYLTAKSFGSKLGVAGLILTPLDAAINGKWQNHHTADALISSAFLIAGMIPGINLGVAIIGFTYYAVDLGFKIKTGKSITEYLD